MPHLTCSVGPGLLSPPRSAPSQGQRWAEWERGQSPKDTEVLPSGIRGFSPVAVAQGTRVHPADRTQLLGQGTRGTSARRREGPRCVFSSAGEGVRLGALPRWAGLDAWREKRKHLPPCRAVDAGLCCVKAVGGPFCAPSRQSPCPFAETGLCALGRLSRCFAPDLTNSGTLIVPSGIWGQLKRRGNMAAIQKLYIVIKPEECICIA